jgi:hypothetical protein
MQRLELHLSLLVLDLLMLILRQTASSTYNAINKGQFFKCQRHSIANCRSESKADGDIVTVTGVLTVSDQFAGSPFKTKQVQAVLTKQFMVPDSK